MSSIRIPWGVTRSLGSAPLGVRWEWLRGLLAGQALLGFSCTLEFKIFKFPISA